MSKQVYEIASFGCGIDSVAGLLLMKDESYPYDEIIFADTGSEKPETYAYLDYVKQKLGWNIKVVRSKYGNIYDYYYNKKIYPTRFARDCTGKFKLDPINKYLRTMYGKQAHFNMHIFIDYSEVTRIRTSKYNYSTLIYPLVERKISREDCKRIITEHGLPIPAKSGCFFCPFTPPKVWANMKLERKELFDKSLALEKNSVMRHKTDFPLIVLKGKESQDLFDCGCFNVNQDTKANEIELDKLWRKPF